MDLYASDVLENLKPLITAAEYRKAAVITNDARRAMAALNDESSVANRRNFSEAEEALTAYVGGLVATHLGGGKASSASVERFKNRKAALAWMRSNGVSISQGKFYTDCADGMITVHPDKSISKYQVSQYMLALQRTPGNDAASLDRAEEKERLEIRKLQLDVAKRERDERAGDARWMLAEDAWAAVAALLATINDNLKHQLYEAQGMLVHLAGGDPSRAPELYEECLAIVARAYNELAGARINGMFDVADDARYIDEVSNDEQE